MKLTILGAQTKLGQAISILLAKHPRITHLALFDVCPKLAQTAAKLTNVPRHIKITTHIGPRQIPSALVNSDILFHCAALVDSLPHSFGRSGDQSEIDLAKVHKDVVFEVVRECAVWSPNSHLIIATQPINYMVPIAAATLKHEKVYNPSKLYGFVGADSIDMMNVLETEKIGTHDDSEIQLIGGSSAKTIIPLLPRNLLSDREYHSAIIKKIRNKIVNIKSHDSDQWNANQAVAAEKFISKLITAITEKKSVKVDSFVQSTATDAPFFKSQILVNSDGIEKILPLKNLSAIEKTLLNETIPELINSARDGEKFLKDRLNC